MSGRRSVMTIALGVSVLGASAVRADDAIEASGVTLVAPRDAGCPEIVLPFAAASRYATDRGRDGLHDGIDFKLPEGTPVLAIASGKIISVGAAPRSAGHYVWLQHPPLETGLAFWMYSTYRHVDRAPELEVGSDVKIGQVIGTAGKPVYPNLHIAILAGGGERYEARGASMTVPGARLIDPALVYLRGLGLAEVERMPPPRPGVLIPYVSPDGSIRPPQAKVIWPVACGLR